MILADLNEIKENNPTGAPVEASNAEAATALLEKVNELKDKNPLLALVEFSTSFDP